MTHEVLNQAPALEGHDPLKLDLALREALVREGASWAEEQVGSYGRLMASREMLENGRLANEFNPKLRTHDRFGNRVDEVEFHPSWHALMNASVSHGVHTGPWSEPRPGAHVARAAKMLMASECEFGHGCPMSMTYSAVPALRQQPELAAEWEPRLLSRSYDPRLVPAAQKSGALFGMAMTEKQGGSDVRANTTRAEPIGARGPGQEYALTGHKWFCSAP
ncbi:MAG: DNA alkylation response protein, partial [Deltaproteobacteria bacterium]|nr:DNA alkylation response protein [Deltaproteobacteria bacterium]